MYVLMYDYMYCLYVRVDYTYIDVNTLAQYVYVYVCVCMYVCMYVHMFCVHVCIDVRMCVCMYVHVCVCTYMYVCIYVCKPTNDNEMKCWI